MSFILDALKKAERDRLRGDPKNLDDFASAHWDPYQEVPSSLAPRNWMLACLAITIVFGVGIYIQGWEITPPSGAAPVSTPGSPQVAALSPATDRVKPLQPESAATLRPLTDQSIIVAVPSVPELIIAGHMFIAEGSTSNRLFIGQSSYREGDKINSEWTLVSIKPDHFIISAGDSTEILAYR
jgi:hypothetical protein